VKEEDFVEITKEAAEQAATLLRTLGKENTELREKIAELEGEVESLNREKKAEKVAAEMAARGMIESDDVTEKVASLMDENLDAYEAALSMAPSQGFEIGRVDREKEASAANDSDESSGNGPDPVTKLLYKHLGVTA
jgi:hypothetical protein